MTTEEADALVEMPKTIGEPIQWLCKSVRHQRYRFDVRVLGTESAALLKLTGTGSPRSWGYALLGPGNVCLRKISTPHSGHYHPDGSEAYPEHKHRWTESDGELWTYPPADIRWHDHNLALIDFIQECNIRVLGDVPALVFQRTLENM